MKPERDIEQFVEHIDVDTHVGRDRHVLDTVLQAHEDARQQRHPPTWRIIMKSNTTKLATAAVVLIGIGLFVTILDHMTTPAWAFEQTLNALKNVRAVYTTGRMYDPSLDRDTSFEIWAKSHKDDPTRSGDCRYSEGDDHLCIASEAENVTYVYTRLENPKQAVVYITAGLNRGIYMFPSGNMLAEFKAMAENWQEEIRKDPATGKSYAYITFFVPPVNTAQYWLIQVDVETKLPVRTAVWLNADRQGQPYYEFTTWEFNPDIPEGCFDFDMPASAQVVDCRELNKALAETANLGTSVDGLGLEEACKKVVTAYWDAVMAKDWEAVSTLRPLATDANLDNLKTACESVASVSVTRMNHLGDPGTFVEVLCGVTLKDGTAQHALLNVDVRETATGSMGVVAGAVGPELYEAN